MSDHFEHKIREKLQDADFPFDQDAWAQMEKKLDAITPTHKRRGGFPWWLGGLLLLLGVSTGIAVWYNYGTNKLSVQDVTATKVVPEPGNFPKDERNVNSPAATSSEVPKEDLNDRSSNNVSAHAFRKVDNEPAQTDDNINDNLNITTEITVDNTEGSMGIANVAMPTAASQTELNNIQAYTGKDANIADSLLTEPTELQHVIITPKPSQRRGFALGFAVGPDYSVAPCLMLGNFGVSAGLQLQYAINNRFSISTGAFYAKKTYGATPADYEAPYAFKKVDADCKVLDVPLNLNVTLFESGKHSWAATVGSSSYFMLREEYKMYYNNNNLHKYVYDNGSQHYFSILNLGISYQQQAARHVMWGITPYAKVPLAGVGHGKVKLTSFGFMLHVNLTQY